MNPMVPYMAYKAPRLDLRGPYAQGGKPKPDGLIKSILKRVSKKRSKRIGPPVVNGGLPRGWPVPRRQFVDPKTGITYPLVPSIGYKQMPINSMITRYQTTRFRNIKPPKQRMSVMKFFKDAEIELFEGRKPR